MNQEYIIEVCQKIDAVAAELTALGREHHQADDFARPLKSIAKALREALRLLEDNDEILKMVVDLARDYLYFNIGQFYWFREANNDTDLSAVNEKLHAIGESLKE